MKLVWTILAERVRSWRDGGMSGPLLLAFCCGIGVLQGQTSLPEWTPLLGAIAALALLAGGFYWLDDQSSAATLGRYGRHIGRALLLVLALLLGFAWAAWRAEWRLADELPLAWERRDISVIGVVAELPREFERGRRFVFAVEKVETPGARVPERILLSWFAGAHEDQWLDDRALNPGERWRFTVRLKRPHGNANPGGFDYEGWLLERGLRATGYVRANPPAERLGEVWTLTTAIERVRATLRHNLQNKLDHAAFAGVIIALAIGDQGSIDPDHWRVFAATGVTHLVSISGLHITMMAALFGGLINWFWRRYPRGMLWLPAQRVAVLSGWLAAFAYTLLAGASLPAVRTLLMLSVGALAHTLDRRVSPLRILLLALFAVLLADPWAVLVVGFWLSFAAVAVLLFFAAREDVEAAAPESSPPPAGRLFRLVELLRQWGWAQWVVTLGTVPLVLTMFQMLSLASPLANALAIPLVGFVIAPLSIAAALLPLPGLAELAHGVLSALMWPLEWLADQSWALWRQAAPAAWTVGLATGGVVLHLAVRAWRWRLAALVLLLPLFFWPAPRPLPGEVWIDLLDVGQGLSALVRTAERNLVFDAGPRYSPDTSAGERLVLPALRALGVTRLDGLVISHQDHDHAGGAPVLLAELPVGWLASSIPEPHFLRGIGNARQLRCERGQEFTWDGVSFRFVSPPGSYYGMAGINTNRLSCILRIEAAGQVALLTGDAEVSEERALQAAGEPGKVDVLQVAHHGSRSSSSPSFVQAVSPRLALFPVGYRNPFLHPHAEVVERYGAGGAQMLRTDLDGAVHVELGRELKVNTQRQAFPRYWHGH